MIWMDSSFAIDWLQGNENAKVYFTSDKIDLDKLALIPFQYLEILAFFHKRSRIELAADNLKDIQMVSPTRENLLRTATIYVDVKKKNSKISYADAALASMALEGSDAILTFDNDFKDLGFHKVSGFWYPKK